MTILRFTILFILLSISISYGQAVIQSIESKTGILIGGKDSDGYFDFARINYNSGSSAFSLDYRYYGQKSFVNPNDKYSYPNTAGFNITSSVSLSENRSVLVNDDKWQGKLKLGGNYFYQWFKVKPIGKAVNQKPIPNVAAPASNIKAKVSGQNVKFRESTLYLNVENSFGRINLFDTMTLNTDTTFISINDPFQNTLSLTPGFYQNIFNDKSKFSFSWAVSINFNFINKSVRGLKKSNLLTLTDMVMNKNDSSLVYQGGKLQEYHVGKTEFELYTIPRLDFFARMETGTNSPVIGILASYSPLISSLSNLGTRHGFAIGPTFSTYTFADNVIFTIQNQFIQDIEKDFKYSLIFQASVPFKFE